MENKRLSQNAESLVTYTQYNKKKQKGITLIALIITIIALLILAGVVLAALSGENGILLRATESKQETQKSGAEEKIKLAIMASFEDNGAFNVEQFKQEVTKQGRKNCIRR